MLCACNCRTILPKYYHNKHSYRDSPSKFGSGSLVLEECGSRALFWNVAGEVLCLRVTVGRCFGMWQERFCV
jgi:hypothetical protein